MNEMFLTKIENYSFNEEGIDELKKMSKHVIDWPVVYILNGDKEAYIGETQSAVDRMNQHVAVGIYETYICTTIKEHREYIKSLIK